MPTRSVRTMKGKAKGNQRSRTRRNQSRAIAFEIHYAGIERVPARLRSVLKQRVIKLLTSRIFARLSYSEVSITFVNDRAMRVLNRNYRNKDKPTDVLSFAHDGGPVQSPSLGDLVISTDTAAQQAAYFEVSLLDEYTRLVTHGMLHLAGYDHEDVSRRQAQRMFRTQSALLGRLRHVK